MKRIRVYNDIQREALLYTSKIVDFGLSLIIAASFNEMLTSYAMLRQSKYYKHRVKLRINDALRLRNRKEEELKNAVKDKAYSETYCDSVIDACEEDMNTLRSAIGKIMNDAGVENSDLFAQVEVTRVMLEAAKIHFEEIINECYGKFLSKNMPAMKGLNMKEIFKEFNIESVYKEWEAMCKDLYNIGQSKVDLNDSSVINAFNTIASKFSKGDYINACLDVASKEFPEYSEVKLIKK